MKIWLHRISHHAEVAFPLLEMGYLSIGFDDFSNAEFIEKSCADNGWQYFQDCFEQIRGIKSVKRYSLWRFIAEMKKGDLVVVPGWQVFSIYELTEDLARPISDAVVIGLRDWNDTRIEKNAEGFLSENSESHIDIGIVRAVKAIRKDIPRDDYADAVLASRMKIRNTNADITDLKQNIKKTIELFDKGQPLNIYSQIMANTRRSVLDTIRYELSPAKFEHLVKSYFQRIGASDVYMPSKKESGKDSDADVVAVFEPIRTIIYAQVKFQTRETSYWAIEQIKNFTDKKEESMDDEYTRINWIISACDRFSKDSYSMAREAKVQLVDGYQFTGMLINAGIGTLDKAM